MCLLYAKFIAIFHVGTKWFVCGKPKLLTAEASQKTDHITKIVLLNKKWVSSLIFVAVQTISITRGSRMPLYKSDGS